MAILIQPHLRLKGSTLVEVVVALVVMTIVFGIATLTYVRLINSSNTPALKLQQQLATLAARVQAQETPGSHVYTLENAIQVQQHVQPYASNPAVWQVELEAFDRQGKPIGIYRILIPNNHAAP